MVGKSREQVQAYDYLDWFQSRCRGYGVEDGKQQQSQGSNILSFNPVAGGDGWKGRLWNGDGVRSPEPKSTQVIFVVNKGGFTINKPSRVAPENLSQKGTDAGERNYGVFKDRRIWVDFYP
jgi:hypothetical protein